MSTRKDSILNTLNTLQDALDKVEGELDERVWQPTSEKVAKIRASTEHTVVGLIGPSGAGKSTLINRMLGKKLLHTSSGGASCSVSKVKVYNKPDDEYHVTVQHYNEEGLARFLLPEEVDGEKEAGEQKVADEVLAELWESVSDIPARDNVRDVMDLIPPKFVELVLDPAKRRDRQSFRSVEEAHAHLKSISKEKGRAFLVQEIIVSGPFPELEENVCLMDIPGSGDTLFLSDLMRKGLEQSDIVLFVEEQTRFANAGVIERLEKSAYQYERKLGFALCASKSGEGFKEFQNDEDSADEVKRAKLSIEEAFVASKIEMFERSTKKYSKLKLWEKLRGMRYFFLETGSKVEEEPRFSQQQRTELKAFIKGMAKGPEKWEIIKSNADAMLEDIMSYEHKPLVESLDDEDLATIKRIFQGENEFKLLPAAAETPLSLDGYKYYRFLRNTLRQSKSASCSPTPAIPVWDHVRSNAVNLQQVTGEILRFNNSYLRSFREKMQAVSDHFTAKLGADKAKFVTNRLHGALLERLENCYNSSNSLLREKLTFALAERFGEHVPVYQPGKGAIERNKQALTKFMADNMEEMKAFVLGEYMASFFTLERAFNECVRDLDTLNEELWRPVKDFELLVDAIKSRALGIKQENEPDGNEPSSGSPPIKTDPFDALDNYIQTRYNGRLPSLKNSGLKNVRYAKNRVKFYLGTQPMTEDRGLTKIGITEDVHKASFQSPMAAYPMTIIPDGAVLTDHGLLFKRIMCWLFQDSRTAVNSQTLWFSDDREVMKDVMNKVHECLESL